ncbi:ABC transporter permease [Novipirellula artificiosorum]|uniref:ABC-2 family transporter protein n=1 Tax=Novipirellula artificiosorum TaxID=2528016 RepID=A0A5C6DQP6_9BACT|nr:ABC transporter permease [Novipirellula artificiosorum]TWU37336.1 ABC-2 family transporter protein [Novipirellula artificiosorum]
MNIILLRKEFRQLAPLVTAVLLLGLLGFALIEMRPAGWYGQLMSSGYPLLAIPALYAVGAGAMSVSQEKETRTLGWLSSLPLANKRLITTKFSAAVVFWAGLWLVTLLGCYAIESLGTRLFPIHDRATNPIHSMWLVYWILNSFYLLVIGFLTAWRFRSSMTALVMFIPLAIAPAILRFAIAYVQNPFLSYNSSLYDATLGQCLIVVGCSLAFSIWLMNRFARQSLAPEETRLSANPYASVELATDTTIQTSQSVLRPSSAMLWQFFHQNKSVYLSLFGASLVVGVISLGLAPTIDHRNGGWEAFAVFSLFLATAWMGVLVFQGDNLQERIRFLSEQGIGPSKVWITRQLLPFGFVCCACLFYLLVLTRYIHSMDVDEHVPLWLAFWFLAFAYGYAQWFAQLVRNPVLSAIGGPIIAGIALTVVVFVRVDISTRFVCMAAFSVAPFLATFLMMGRWMDRRFGWQFWCTHAAILGLVIMLPIADLAWYVWNSPRMPKDVKVAFREEGRRMGESPRTDGIFLGTMISEEPYEFGEPTIEQRIARAEKRADVQHQINQLRQEMASPNVQGLRIGGYEVQNAVGNLVLARHRLERNADDPLARKDYQRRVEFLYLIADSARRSIHLRSQEAADYAEIALIAELQRPDTQARIGDDTWDRYVALVSDREARNESRRRAVVACWYQFDQTDDDDKHYGSLANFHPNTSWRSGTKHLLTHNARIDHLAWVLLRYLEQGQELSASEKVDLLRQRWPADSNHNNQAAFLLPKWIEDPAQSDWYSFNTAQLPGDQWFAGWEQVGAKLNPSTETFQ